ncbi:DUF3626 domain-containing protein [Oxobacter pfennigii]|nr:DUF3626 domain-containing protein [Oxobacter pfennigii]
MSYELVLKELRKKDEVIMIRDYELKTIKHICTHAKKQESEKLSLIEELCNGFSYDIDVLINKLLSAAVTINFHADRLSNNGAMIIENLIDDGMYFGQFKTGTTNGGKTAYIGGDRFLWEQRLFSNIYPENTTDRPKYGALNIFEYLDGASPRFGSCYFALKPDIISRCTFAYGDSSTNPDILCTADSFYGILAGLLLDVKQNGRLLDKENYTIDMAIDELMSIGDNKQRILGRNLDYCIETHIHGDIMLNEDIESLYMDESFRNTDINKYANILCERYDIKLEWIPVRQIRIDDIGDEFRGPMIKPLAQKIDSQFGNFSGVINAWLIGKASRDSTLNPACWEDIGDKEQVFQYIKQLWHTAAYFG